MSRSSEGVVRFGVGSRAVHGCTGMLVLSCIATAAVLYNGSLANLLGHRYLVRQIHLWSGFALAVPLLAGLVSRGYRADLSRLNRFGGEDWRWLRSKRRRDVAVPVGKFNAGQKLNAALSAGALAVLVLTGSVMYFSHWTSLSWRSGATFTHDWFALGLGLLVMGHVLFALRDPISLRSAGTGRVPLSWARAEHPGWAEELAGPVDPRADVTGAPTG